MNRKKGHQPGMPHPSRPWQPDVPGHKDRKGVRTNHEGQLYLKNQLDKLREELISSSPSELEGGSGHSGEKKG